VRTLARRAGRPGRSGSRPRRGRPGSDRHRRAARPAHRPDRNHLDPRQRPPPPPAPARRQRLGTPRRLGGVTHVGATQVATAFEMKALLSWSGGKDAAWTLHTLRRQGVDVVGLVTTVTERYERIAMQGINLDVLAAQARATGLPVIQARMPRQASDT